MLQALFHAWERRLASATKDRVVRPFEWGLDWIPPNPSSASLGACPPGAPAAVIGDWVSQVMADTDAFFTPPPTSDYSLRAAPDGDVLTFPSALETPHAENNTVYGRYFPAALKGRPTRDVPAGAGRAAVLVLPQWNSDAGGHVGLSKLLAWNGLSALRLSLPYHDQRMPSELRRADYIVSANVARTVQVCRQAVLDARRAIDWLEDEGFDRIGMLGTSLGSCLSMLTTVHEPRVRAAALNHVSPWFADVVWRGLSTRHVRAGLEGQITLDALRELWQPISPYAYLGRSWPGHSLLVYARYDLTFPVDLSRVLVKAYADHGIAHNVATLPCGHYSSGMAPFKFLDAYVLIRYLRRKLL